MSWKSNILFAMGSFSLLTAFQDSGFANELSYDSQSIDSYFESAEHFAILVRISGGIDEYSYTRLQEQFDVGTAPDSKSVSDWYQAVRNARQTKYLVIRNLVGTLSPVIDVLPDGLEKAKFPLGEPVAAIVRSTASEGVFAIDMNDTLDSKMDIVTQFDGDMAPIIDYFRQFLPDAFASPEK